jgi:hypothetical protein
MTVQAGIAWTVRYPLVRPGICNATCGVAKNSARLLIHFDIRFPSSMSGVADANSDQLAAYRRRFVAQFLQ